MKITIDQAEEYLCSGEVIAVPTETVYGLAALMRYPSAIEQIFHLKNRPTDNPLIVHVSSKEEAASLYSTLPESFHALAATFWPGPITIIATARKNLVPEIVRCGLDTVGIRVPNHPLTLELIKRVGPIVAPSANLSGLPSSTTRQHVEEDFGLSFPTLDGGPCSEGVESTIISERGEILREGAIPREELAKVIGISPVQPSAIPRCPGQKYRHYSPKAKLSFGDEYAETVVGFEERDYPHAKRVYLLGSLRKPEQIARNLYRVLRQLDHDHVDRAWVDLDFPRHGLFSTIYERLKKAL